MVQATETSDIWIWLKIESNSGEKDYVYMRTI